MDNKEVLSQLISGHKYAALSNMLKVLEPADIALLLQDLERESMIIAYRLLPKELAAEAFVYMDAQAQQSLIEAFSDWELTQVLNELFLDDTVDIIEEMPASLVKRILKSSNPQMRAAINQVLKYPGDSAGSIMTIEYVNLKRDMTVSQAFERIRRTGVDKETIYTCYVTDENRRLIGVLSVKTLLLSGPEEKIGDIMEQSIISVGTLDDRESAALLFSKYGFMALPVVDRENRLVGIITVDDALTVLQEETTEDISKMGAVSPLEQTYFRTGAIKHAKNRILWLLLLMLSSTLSGLIITRYERAFIAFPLLISFIPMLMGTGGNCGSQSSTMVIRGLALGEISFGDFFKVIWKEVRVALMVGAVIALVNGVRIALMYGDIAIAVVTGLTLMVIAVLAKLLGGILPMLAKKLRLDPAIMASPIITTIVDACAVFFYFNIAIWILKI
jgi:magnesium transporter